MRREPCKPHGPANKNRRRPKPGRSANEDRRPTRVDSGDSEEPTVRFDIAQTQGDAFSEEELTITVSSSGSGGFWRKVTVTIIGTVEIGRAHV